ncbi:DUF4157 domain-containing protein [Streptomyces sp. NBC_00057]|uniref:eCIS core domain-containing protein n=1 Tax=Streptomyces sp. NBC_00057 TaxID=2975634 RepID=UPI00386981AA
MREHENVRKVGNDDARWSVRSPETAPRPLPSGLFPLQATMGNAAVVQMLRQAGHRWAEEAHQHSAECGHDQVEQPAVQRSAVHGVLRAPGRPLDDGTREEMEARFGADFSDVRIHDDSAAHASAAEIGARAYTSGSHIVIGDSGGDKHTLAHELTHVIQQRQGPVAGTDNGSGLRISDPSDPFEREAEANARRVLADHTPVQRIAGKPLAQSTTIQRMRDDDFDELMNERDTDASDDEMDYEFAFEEALRFAPPGTGTEEPVEEPVEEPTVGASRLKRANDRSTKRGVPAKGDLVGSKPETPFGTVSLNQGYKGDLGTVVKSRKDDYPGTQGREWEKYAHLLPHLSPAQRVALADTMKADSPTPGNARLFEQDSEAKRAAAVLYGVAHNSEELRFPGAGKVLRAALRKNGGRYSVDEFYENFPMAKPGGAGSFRGDPELTPQTLATLEAMSDSSEEE